MRWLGTEENYRLYHQAHEPLVRMMLKGVEGVSPSNGHKQIRKAVAKQQLDRGKVALAKMEHQTPAPTAAARKWMATLVGKMKALLLGAERVYAGARLPKMTPAYYRQLNERLGL